MNRYQSTERSILLPGEDITKITPRYLNVKYPEISRDFSDIYIYSTQGDRYDLLANSYYKDSSLWWIISISNQEVSYDSLIPPIGKQIRIPGTSRISSILNLYDSLNNTQTYSPNL